jgi:hypothetical protein
MFPCRARSQADESLIHDKSIVADFRNDRDHGGMILEGKLL